jgi:predicted permease
MSTKWLSDLVQDIQIAVRTLRRRPIIAIVPVLSSALGISACSLVVGIANVALFRPLPVENSAALMSIGAQNLKTGAAGSAMSYPDYRDLTKARSLAGVAAYFPMLPGALSREGAEARRYWGTIASANYFDVVRPGFALGRGFDSARDDAPGSQPVVVLSHRLWLSRFGGDPGILGRGVVMNGRSVTVIGVTPPGFRGTDVAMVSDFWVPFSMRDTAAQMLPANKLDIFADRDAKWLFVVGRLPGDGSRAQADAEAKVIGERLAASFPATNRDRTFHVERAGQLAPSVRRAMLVFFLLLLFISGLVLLTACANIANLLLARATARCKEMATRRAVGAGAGRMVRQLLTESVLLALMGGALGYAFAALGAGYFGHLRLPIALPVDFTISLDYRVLLVCTALSFVTGIVFGLAPALHAIRPNLVSALRDQPSQTGRPHWWTTRNILMAGQVAVCMMLLVCSGLFVRTLSRSRSAETGMANGNVLLIGFDPFLQRGLAERDSYLSAILRRASEVPGVETAALTTSVPLSLAGISGVVTADDKRDAKDAGVDADIYEVSPGFFETLGIRLIAGADFRQGNSDVVILNRAAVGRLFPSGDPIGRRVQVDDRRMMRVIGVVATTKSRMMAETARPCIYKPLLGGAASHSITGITLLVRTRGNAAAYVQPVTSSLNGLDRTLALFDIRTMEQHLNDALLLQRASAFLFGMAGLIGLAIAATGLYGLISFLVARQTKEFAIRMALGARRGQIVAGVLRRGLRLTAAGAAVGLVLSTMLGKGVASLLYGVSSTDALTFGSVTIFLFLTATAACLVPAIRAANVPPAAGIRCD